MKLTPIEVLQKARQLITDPAHWTTSVFAKNLAGENVRPESSDACRWCAYGAIAHIAYDSDSQEAADELLRKTAFDKFGEGPLLVNDHQGHEATLQMFDLAIKEAKS